MSCAGRVLSDPGAAIIDTCIFASSSANDGRRNAGNSARPAETHPIIPDRSAAAAAYVISVTNVVHSGGAPAHVVRGGSARRALARGVKEVSGLSNAGTLAPNPLWVKGEGAGALRRQDQAAALEEYRIDVMQTFNSPETSIMRRWLLLGPLVCCAIAAFFQCCVLAAEWKASSKRRRELEEMDAFVRTASAERLAARESASFKDGKGTHVNLSSPSLRVSQWVRAGQHVPASQSASKSDSSMVALVEMLKTDGLLSAV